MTLLEAFELKSGIADEKATALLEFEGLNPADEWDTDNQTLKCAFYKILLGELSRNESVGIKSISEGGYKIEYDKNDKAKGLYDLALESGCSSLIDKYHTNSVVENKSYLW